MVFGRPESRLVPWVRATNPTVSASGKPGGSKAARQSPVGSKAAGSGPGIPADDLPYIFDRFYRSAKARALPGSGLGLAIVRRIADMHDGTVEAIPLRRGMKFRISVPETAVDPPIAERTRYAAGSRGRNGSPGAGHRRPDDAAVAGKRFGEQSAGQRGRVYLGPGGDP
jgi:hypothetical protein